VNADGSAGTPEVLAGPDCDVLGGADGLALSGGSLYATVNALNKVVVVSPTDGTTTTYYEGDPLASPASLAFGGPSGDLYVTNAAFAPGQTASLAVLTER
jgi:sugar lactone lactonase YvrE